nr:phosphatase PAP2 family protein [Pseudobdellovibrionaceae bacterium]
MLELLLQWDEAGLKFVNQVFTNSFFDWFFPNITDLHDTLFFKVILVPALLLTLIYKYKKKGLALFFMLLVSLGISDGLGNYGFKKTFQRPRPHTITELNIIQRSPSAGFSFISNHSTNMFNFATYLSAFFPQYKILLYSMASLVAYSRVYNGAHYPSDVFLG